jgi:hypothetical protein
MAEGDNRVVPILGSNPPAVGPGSGTSPIGILFTQRMMDFPEPPIVVTDFWMLAYRVMEQ